MAPQANLEGIGALEGTGVSCNKAYSYKKDMKGKKRRNLRKGLKNNRTKLIHSLRGEKEVKFAINALS